MKINEFVITVTTAGFGKIIPSTVEYYVGKNDKLSQHSENAFIFTNKADADKIVRNFNTPDADGMYAEVILVDRGMTEVR